MKKTYIQGEIERYALYVGIERVHGGWIMETGGEPNTLEYMEEALSDANDADEYNAIEAELDEINAIIDDPTTPWEELREEDVEYIEDTLRAWGI